MKYSMNPFRWLLWLCRKAKYRKSKWQKYFCPKPLSRRGREDVEMRLWSEAKRLMGH